MVYLLPLLLNPTLPQPDVERSGAVPNAMGAPDFLYNAEHRVVVCRKCRTCLAPGGPKAWRDHLGRKPHWMKGDELRATIELLSTYDLRGKEELRKWRPNRRTPCETRTNPRLSVPVRNNGMRLCHDATWSQGIASQPMPATVGGLRPADLFHRERAHRLLRGASSRRASGGHHYPAYAAEKRGRWSYS